VCVSTAAACGATSSDCYCWYAFVVAVTFRSIHVDCTRLRPVSALISGDICCETTLLLTIVSIHHARTHARVRAAIDLTVDVLCRRRFADPIQHPVLAVTRPTGRRITLHRFMNIQNSVVVAYRMTKPIIQSAVY